MSRELLKQALDALDAITDKIDGTGFSSSNEFSHCLDTIDALRAALAQPQAEPVAEVRAKSDAYGGTFVQWYSLPVAGMKLYATPQQAPPIDGFGGNLDAAFDAVPVPDGWVMVPTHPTEDQVLAGFASWNSNVTGVYAAMIAAAAAAPVVPDGMALVPDYRGYAALGTGQYLLDISGDANPAELIIHVATDAEKEGRTVGDLRDKPNPGEVIQPEKMAVRLAFFTVAGLDALEQQLRILRETHFPESAAPAVSQPTPRTADCLMCGHCAATGERVVRPAVPLTEEQITKALRRAFSLGQTYWQQADSDSYKQNAKSDETRQKFETLIAETLNGITGGGNG